MHSKHLATPLLSFALLAACQKENKPEAKPGPTTPELPVLAVATATISSVQMLEDCPDPKPATGTPASPKPAQAPAKSAPAESMPASMAPARPGDQAYAPPCQQSTMQVSFAGQGPESSKVVVKELRLLTAEGKSLATIETRLPTIWNESVYTAWDEQVQPGKDIQVSYKISPPAWHDVETALGSPTHGKMFVLEADIEVGGKKQTVRSIEFARIQPQMVPT
jgi:hypothetical protein